MSGAEPKFTIFLALRARVEWLRLPRSERNAIGAAALRAALQDLPVRYRHFDAEGFSSFCSDIALFESADMVAFYAVMERLRDSEIFARPYFDLVQIIPTLEEGYRQFELSAA